MPECSVVIRSLEEERYLRWLVSLLRRQTVQELEIILVVDFSRPDTLSSLESLAVDRLIPLPHHQFNHAYSTNLGVEASGGEFVAITNGHSLPLSDRWLEMGIKHFSNPKVAGVTGLYTPLSDGSMWEKFYYSPLLISLYRGLWLQRLAKSLHYHWFQTTNCMLRRNLWEIYPFDESLPSCEDYDWGLEMEARGYQTVVDPDFSVYHSHHDGLGKFFSRKHEWDQVRRRITLRERPRSSSTQLSSRRERRENRDLVAARS